MKIFPKAIQKKFFRFEKEAREDIKKIAELIEYEETKLVSFMHSAIRKIFGPIVKSVWIKEVDGIDNILKDGPLIMAFNHESYFDFICFIAVSPRKIHYLAAEKFFESRLWRPFMKATGQIKVNRRIHDKTESQQMVFSALKQGRVIGIFPEGTRSPDGNMLKAFTGVAKFALKSKVPVVPVGLVNTRKIMTKTDKFPKFKKVVKIRIGEPIYLREYHDIDYTPNHFRGITDAIMLKIANLCEKEYSHVEHEKLIKI